MFCPTCGVENNQESIRFCRSCGADLRAVSQALSKSLPSQIASTVDAYLQNRYQQNMRSGVINVIAFLALLLVGSGHLYFGWTKMGIFMLALGVLSLFFGAWDIWIYRRNLPPIAKQSLSSNPNSINREVSDQASAPPLSVTEPTTKKLDLVSK